MLGELTVQDLWWLARTAAEEVEGPTVIQASYANRFATWVGLAQTTFAGAIFAYLALAANYLASAAAKPPPTNSDVITVGISVLAILLTIAGSWALFQASRSARLYLVALRLFVQFSP
jgi:hypothetical protein